MVTRVSIIILLVLVLAFLIHLTIQVKKGKTIVFVFGKLSLTDLANTIPLSTVSVPAIIQEVKKDTMIVGTKAVGFLKGITY